MSRYRDRERPRGLWPLRACPPSAPGRQPGAVCQEMVCHPMGIESPLIGSGSQEEVDLRVNALIDLGKSRGYLTYDELNERLPDEVVSPEKLDSLLMMIDEMGIKLIDDMDIAEFTQKPPKKGSAAAKEAAAAAAAATTQSKDGVAVPAKGA